MEMEKEQLNQINVHSLRSIARELGVKAPTSLSKPALIDEILKIKSGEKQPYTPTKRGRRVKKSVASNNGNETTSLNIDLISIKANMKKEFINSILKEVENKLNELLN